MRVLSIFLSCLFYLLLNTGLYAADVMLKPFILAGTEKGNINDIAESVKKKLTDAGFEVAGEYAPYDTAHIIIVTNERLKNHAAQSRHGAYGAVQRVSVTQSKEGDIQISYTNPTYMANAYQMNEDLADVKTLLQNTLGVQREYGSEEGVEKEDLRDYHYTVLMPYFTDHLELASYGNHKKALEKVETYLAKKVNGVSKIYRVDIPGKEESVFGVKLPGPESNECSGDEYIMDHIDFKDIKSTGHLPYELIVTGGEVYALYAEFRIAINFPDLSMVGSNSFASIMCAPSGIEEALTEGVGGELTDDF